MQYAPIQSVETGAGTPDHVMVKLTVPAPSGADATAAMTAGVDVGDDVLVEVEVPVRLGVEDCVGVLDGV